MNKQKHTAAQLREEIAALRARNAELEALNVRHQEAETRFRLLAENSTDFISRHTPTGLYLYASPACRRLLGYEPEELIGHPAYEFFHPDDIRSIATSHTTILEQRIAATVSYRIRRKDGAYIWFETTSHAILDRQTGEIVEIQTASRDITERKRIEEELAQYRTRLEETIAERTAELTNERNLLRILIDNMPDLILIKDQESRFLAVNQALAHLMGAAEPHDLIGKTDFDFYPYDYAQHYFNMERELLASGQPSVNDEELHTDPDTGEPRWFLATKIPFRDEQGVIRGLVGISRDITERKQIEEELQHHREHLEELVKERTAELVAANERLTQEIAERKQIEAALLQSQTQYKLVVEMILDYIFHLSLMPDGTFLMDSVTENFSAVTGRTIEDAQTLEQWRKIISSDDYPQLTQALQQVIVHGKSVEFECRSFTQSGGVRWIHIAARPEWDASRTRIVGVIGAVKDVTDRRFAEDAQRQAQKDWQEIFQAVGHPTLILDPEQRILAANRAAVEATRMTEQELLAKRCFEIFHLTSDSPTQCPMTKMLATGTFETVEMVMNALERTFLVSCTPVRDEQGKLQKIIHIATDITERKRAEEKIQQLNAELEDRVKQRTAELQIANEELRSFAYIVSHDLKAPLRGIHHLSQWLMLDYRNIIDESGQEILDLLLKQVKRLDSLIDGILQYSRAGGETRTNVTIHLAQLLTEIIESLALPETVHITLDPELPDICADQIRIRQVFQNLLSNAIKYLDKPTGEIAVRCCLDGNYWRFSVSDNGMGIEAQHYERIFRVFQTLQTRDDVESTGIGLAIVKKIVESYGGKVWVESTVGQGSTFYFTLPKINSGAIV
ncbi:multi-sensor signal transduction histidine kinase [Candidatus Moduliflexus flocculans]|uniref:histidine kinase n=1 Tax=Candidatus Moduliflexus flocculans TaxID=1499966 RepID=A0A0S6VY00_9BACT|nr:multi-sensor signal transduction histidine kinase [Candidatus Moduliflexus flocculans]